MSVLALLAPTTEAVSEVSTVTEHANWFLEHAWIIPLLPAISFVLILFFGKRMPKKGAEFGIAAVGLAFVLAVCTGVAWLDHRDNYAFDGGTGGDHSTEVVDEATHDEAPRPSSAAAESEAPPTTTPPRVPSTRPTPTTSTPQKKPAMRKPAMKKPATRRAATRRRIPTSRSSSRPSGCSPAESSSAPASWSTASR
ncbi:MAG: hypothetical protein R2695_07010 [Acidimicrobiales bacterium]